MNKRISTLLTIFILLVSTVFAQGVSSINEDIRLKAGSNEGLYRIQSVGNAYYIYVNQNGELSAISPSLGSYEFLSHLWCINVDDYNQGQAPIFNFTNNLQGHIMGIGMSAERATLGRGVPFKLKMGGDLTGWAFSRTYENGIERNCPIFCYYKADSVVALMLKDNQLWGVKLGANEVYQVAATDNKYQFNLEKAGRYFMNAANLNTMLGLNPGGTSFKLNFEKTVEPNVFANELMAKDTIIGIVDYVTFVNKSTGRYVRVDTAYHNTTGVKFVQFTDTTSYDEYVASASGSALPNGMKTDNYAFRFEYDVYSDSVFITVQGAVLEQEAGKTWAQSYRTTNKDSLNVYVQDLGTSSVLTVGSSVSEIRWGFGGWGDPSTKTTLPTDLYVIKATNDKYLAVPMTGDTTAQWVTLEKNVDPWTMPSFQWVLEKAIEEWEISPFSLTNREFPEISFANIKLDKESAYALQDDKGVAGDLLPDGFEAATAAIKADSLLGYKYVDPASLQVSRYKFRYLHEFSDKGYVGVNREENDSVLYVGGKSPFSVKVVKPLTRYGYTSRKVTGLKPLYRQEYAWKMQSPKLIFGTPADSVGLDEEGRFSVSKYLHPDTFLWRANNKKTIDGKDILFYAFLKINGDTTKVGTDDNNLWLKNQIITESRTSAFSVEVDDSPLYRRFNTTKKGEKATDDPDTVKFFRVNNPADMLFEDGYSVYSKDLNINFLGVNNSVQFPDVERAIYVDTAYVKRGTGYIKPQYLLAVGVDIIPGTPGEPCPLDHNHGFDKDGNPLDANTCSHAIPGTQGYVRGRYLINTVDSAKVNGDYTVGGVVRDADYIWNNQVRLAFVEAIHQGDTLYILKGDTAKLADPIDLSKIGTKIRLDNNNHKNVVFSFRLIEEGNDDFLIESAATPATDVIAPMKGGWVKIQNGVPVISYGAFSNAANESEIFNVTKTTDTPTANEGTAASTEVSVQTVAGGVVIRNAAGKSVTISNILGKQVAKSVLTSDNETIDVPAGIVVVVVEGEEVVKAIVK